MSLTVLHAPPPSPPLLLPPRWSLKAPAQALRTARTCYDHVAGRVGVDIMAAMIRRGQLTGGDGTFNPDLSRRDRRTGYGHDVDYTLDAQGQQFLTTNERAPASTAANPSTSNTGSGWRTPRGSRGSGTEASKVSSSTRPCRSVPGTGVGEDGIGGCGPRLGGCV